MLQKIQKTRQTSPNSPASFMVLLLVLLVVRFCYSVFVFMYFTLTITDIFFVVIIYCHKYVYNMLFYSFKNIHFFCHWTGLCKKVYGCLYIKSFSAVVYQSFSMITRVALVTIIYIQYYLPHSLSYCLY